MRKRIFMALAILICFMACIAGCTKKEPDGFKIEISYLNKSETKLIPEQHYLSGENTKEMIVEVLRLLCEVPDNKELKATISGGVNIINYSFTDGRVTVSLGEKYKELSKTTEILTRAAIVKSLSQIPEVEYVMITIGGEPLLDYSGNEIGIMTADMFLDNTDEQMNHYEKITIRLYFANETGDGLIAINRSLLHNIGLSNVPMEKLVVEQLIAGPANTDSYPSINPETKILGVTVKDGVCYLNLDSSILTPVNNVTSDVAIFSIVNSLVELSNINKVQISIDGKNDMTFKDKYDLTTLFERNLQLLY